MRGVDCRFCRTLVLQTGLDRGLRRRGVCRQCEAGSHSFCWTFVGTHRNLQRRGRGLREAFQFGGAEIKTEGCHVSCIRDDGPCGEIGVDLRRGSYLDVDIAVIIAVFIADESDVEGYAALR